MELWCAQLPSCCTNLHSVLQHNPPTRLQSAPFQPVDWLFVTLFTERTAGMETATYWLLLYTDTQREVVFFYAAFSAFFCMCAVTSGCTRHASSDSCTCTNALLQFPVLCAVALTLAWFGLPVDFWHECSSTLWQLRLHHCQMKII